MTNRKIDSSNHKHQLWAVTLDRKALEYLRDSANMGISRLGAYIWLLTNCVKTRTSFKPPYGQPFYLEPSQIVISITDLGQKWQWARETVRSFLSNMESLGLLTKEQLDRCSLITMKIELCDFEPNGLDTEAIENLSFPEKVTGIMDKWLDGDATNAELVEKFEDFVNRFSDTEDDESSFRTVGLQYQMIRQLSHRWATSFPDIPASPDFLGYSLLEQIFYQCLSGDWNKWLSLVRTFSPGIDAEGIETSSSNPRVDNPEAYAGLRKLFKHLGVSFTNPIS